MHDKKKIFAGLVAFAASVGYAQTGIKIYGAIDGGVSWISNQGGRSKLKYDDSIYTPSVLGLEGNEDLGSGTAAIFKLEGAFRSGAGTYIPGAGAFGRQSYVGLKNTNLGTLTIGNQFDFMFDSMSMENNNPAIFTSGLYAMTAGPFTGLGIPANPTGNFVWDRLGGQPVGNAVKYRSGQLNGFSVGAMYALGEVPGRLGEGSTKSFSLNFDRGPFGLASVYTEQKYLFPDVAEKSVAIRNFAIGTHYKFENFVANAMLTTVRNMATNAAIYAISAGVNWSIDNSWQLGSNYIYMNGNERLANSHANQVAATLSHLLSKRARIYVQGVYQRTNSGANALINGITDPGGASSSGTQVITRIGIQSFF